jgi:hypothetical protein
LTSAICSCGREILEIVSRYVVNPDCTGSMTLDVSLFGVTVQADFVIDDDGAELRAIVTDAESIESLVFKKQFPRGPKE